MREEAPGTGRSTNGPRERDADRDGIEALCQALCAYAGENERRRVSASRDAGLNATEGSALIHLRHRGPLTPGDLGELLSLTSGGVTALTNRLHRAGLVARRPHPRDGRSTQVVITAAGLAATDALVDPIVAAVRSESERLSPQERAIISAWLQRMAQHLARESSGEPATFDDALGLAEPMPGISASNLWY